jgi:hypothetical protein
MMFTVEAPRVVLTSVMVALLYKALTLATVVAARVVRRATALALLWVPVAVARIAGEAVPVTASIALSVAVAVAVAVRVVQLRGAGGRTIRIIVGDARAAVAVVLIAMVARVLVASVRVVVSVVTVPFVAARGAASLGGTVFRRRVSVTRSSCPRRDHCR